jgi:hypothetical protein
MVDTIKSFARSQNSPPKECLSFIAFVISLIILYAEFSAELLLLKPYYSLASIPFVHKCLYSLVNISSSNILEKDVNNDIGL